ncbi:hypothetical protein [Jannaschia rubra]|uniref:DUF2726 domain-containing protein n=1 Tax=Jannaschia rubra TaxID=282197 RepID=A0A0M6XLX8_9RHOB|nr:hypothetical protein [Jannaschia rubra]CTQ32156.1 hypothetical protein JAN5088_00919 [Jannaschia rubra]SFG36344.1 hypothetical protein SAMN04488517_10474 [Jannaschia rubra]
MQFDRLMVWLARAGVVAPREAWLAQAESPAAPELRGSGSWASDWTVTRGALERARSLARPGHKRKTDPTPCDAIPEGSIRVRPLMSARDLKLHNWIADRLEAEAPICSLHAGVALPAFLTATTSHEDSDPLRGLVADLLIVDEHGRPVAALLRDNTAEPARHLMLLDALLDADVPIIDIPARPGLAALWDEIARVLPTG